MKFCNEINYYSVINTNLELNQINWSKVSRVFEDGEMLIDVNNVHTARRKDVS